MAASGAVTKKYLCPNCGAGNIVFSTRRAAFDCRACGERFTRSKAVVRVMTAEGSETVQEPTRKK